MDRTVFKRGNIDDELGKERFEETDAAVEPIDDADSAESKKFLNAYAEASQASFYGRRLIGAEHDASLDDNSDHVFASEIAPETDELTGADNPSVGPTDGRYIPADSVPQPSELGVTPRLMTIDDVSAYCRMSKSKIARLEKRDPDFPRPIRIGGSTRWVKDAIDHYIDQLLLRNGAGS